MEIRKRLKNFIPYIVAGILCCCVAIPMFSYNVVLDEAYSVQLVRGSLRDIVAGAASDVHPPLYYLILKLASVVAGGENLHVYRLATMLATWLNLLVLGATVIRRYWGNRVAVFYLLWFGTAYSTFLQSETLRMYSWGAFFVTAAGLSLYAYYQSDRKTHLLLSIALTLAAMYTHYYAVIAVFFLWLFLLLALLKNPKRVWRVLGSGIFIILGYSPWLLVWIKQGSRVASGYWMVSFEWAEWAAAPAQLMDSSLRGIGTVFCALLIAVLVYACLHKNWLAVLGGGVFGLTMITGALVSVLITPMWAVRYSYVAWGMLSMMVALTIGQMDLKKSIFSQVLLTVLLCLAGFFSAKGILEEDVMACDAKTWVENIQAEIDGEAWILADDPGEHRVVYQYYMPSQTIVMTEELREAEAFFEFLKASEGKQRWYVIDYIQARLGEAKTAEMLGKYGYVLVLQGQYQISQKQLALFRIEEAGYEK